MGDDSCPECGYPQPEYNRDAVSDCAGCSYARECAAVECLEKESN